jgi:DNA-binding transcriptional LysR family regulator
MGMDMHRRYEGPEIPLELLRTAAAVEYLGSYFQAGRHLGLSQPSLNARLKRLEKLVGDKIFERSSAGLRPTKRGEVIIEHALRVLSADC